MDWISRLARAASGAGVRTTFLALVAALSVGCAGTSGSGAIARASEDSDEVHVQVCLADKLAVATERTIDVTNIPATFTYYEWEDWMTRVKVLRQIAQSTAEERALVVLREAAPAAGASAAPSRIPVGVVAVDEHGVGSDFGPGGDLRDITVAGQPVYAAPSDQERASPGDEEKSAPSRD